MLLGNERPGAGNLASVQLQTGVGDGWEGGQRRGLRSWRTRRVGLKLEGHTLHTNSFSGSCQW